LKVARGKRRSRGYGKEEALKDLLWGNNCFPKRPLKLHLILSKIFSIRKEVTRYDRTGV
jgi:hypothetical protein